MSEIVGSLGIELVLEREKLDRDLQQLQSLKGGQVNLQAVLDTRLLRQQLNNLSQLKPTIQAQVAITNLNQVESQLKTLTRDRRVRIGIDFDGAGLDRLEARLGQLTNRTVKVGVDVNDAAIDRLNGKLNALTDRIVRVGLAIDESGLDKLEKRLGQFGSKSFKVTAQVDDAQLTALNKHLDLKQKHFTQVNNFFASKPLTPRVDFSGLDALDRRLGDFKNRSIDIKANIADVRQSISQLKQELSGIEIPVTVRTANGASTSATQTVTPKIDSSSIESAITKALDNSFKGFEKNLEGAFKKVGKGNILGGLGDILTAPLKLATGAIGNVISGVGLGVGQQLSKDLGKGISDGIDEQLAPIIGSFRLVGRQAASALTKELVDSLGQDAGLVQGIIQDLIGKDNITVESGAVRSKQRKKQQQNTVEATRFFQTEVDNTDVRQVRAEQQKLASQFATVQQFRDRTSQKTEIVANKLGATQVKQNIEQAAAQLKQQQQAAAQISKQIKAELDGLTESRQALAQLKTSGTADVAQIAEVESSIAQKSSKLAQLQSELKSTSSSSQQIADRITRLTESLGEINKSAESYFRAELDQIVAIEDKLAIAQRKLQQKLQPFEAVEALGTIRTPETIGAEIATRKQSLTGLQQKQSTLKESSRADAKSIEQLRSLRNQELQLPESDQDAAKIKSIEQKILQLQQRQAQRKTLYDDISQAIAKEETQLKSLAAQNAQPLAAKAKSSGLTSELNQLVKKEQETNQIIQDAIASGDETRAKQFLRGRKLLQDRQNQIRQELALLGVEAKTPAARAQTIPAPKVEGTQLATPIGKIVSEVAKVRGESVQAADVPKVIVSDEQTTAKGRNAAFQSAQNSILLSSKLKSNLDSGNLTAEEFQTLVHEIEHAFQFDFGRKSRAQAAQSEGLLKPNAQELKDFGYRIEGSAGGKGSIEEERQSRKLEADAYTFAARNAPQIQAAIRRDQAVTGFEDAAGIGGGKIDDRLTQAQLRGLKQIKSTAQSAPVDLTEEFEAARSRIKALSSEFEPLLAKARNLEILPTDEIVQLQKDLAAQLARAEQRIAQEQAAIEDAAILKPFDVQSQLSDSLGQFNRKKTLVPLAQEFGIENADQLKKPELISQLTSRADLRQLQPRVNELTRAQAQQQIARQERNAAIAQTAGNVARGSIETGRNVASAVQTAANSQPVQAVLGAAGVAVKGLGAVAKTGYALASGLESVALDLIPLGRTIKGVTKQVVLPAAGFAAATHFLPGGQIAAEGISHLLGGAITPLAQAATSSASASASGLIAQAIPQTASVFGHTVPNILAPAAAPITSAVTGAIQSLGASVGEMAVQAGTVILGGKLIQGTVGKAGEAALRSALPQESNARALPAASTRALPQSTIDVAPQVEVASSFEQFTKPQLLSATRKLGIQGTSTKTSKDDLIERLKAFRNQPQVDQVLAQVQAEINRDGSPIAGFDKATEQETLKRLSKSEKDINKKLSQLQTATGKKREKLINEILSASQNTIGEIDQLKGQNFSGETLRSISGTQGRIENSLRNNSSLNAARDERNNAIKTVTIEAQNARVKGLARVAIEEAEPATATLGTTLKEGFRKLTNFAAKQFDVQAQPTIKGTLGAIAKSPKARDLATDLAVNGAGFAASQLGSQFGIVPELAGDLSGALIARQLISRGRPGAGALTGDLAGFAIGNTTAKIANAGLDALSGVVPGAGLLRALPFKGAIAASLTVPKVTKAAEQFQQSPIEGLARAQTPTGFKGLAERFKSLLPSNEKKLAQIQSNYEAIYREIAKLSGAAFDPNNIPKLAIDNKRLKQLGAQAYFEIEQNLITIDREIANALAKPANELSKYTDKLTGLIHEGRHSIQLDGGRLSIDQAAASGQLANGDKLSIDQRAQVEKSVDVARKQGASAQQLESVRKLETDAYAFEGNAGQIVSKASRPDPLQAARLEAELASRSIGSGATIQGLTSDRDIAIVGRAQSNAEKFDQKAARIQRSQDKVFAKQVDPLQGGGEDAASRLKGTIAKEAGDYAKAANESLKALGVNLPGIGKALSGLFSGGASDGFSKINGGLKFLAQNAAIAIKGFVAFQVLSTVVPAIQQFATESVNAAIKLDNLKTALSFGSGGASNAVKDLAFVRGEATRLGVPLSSLQDGFVKLSASTKGTSSAGQTTKDLITGLAQASTTLGLSADESGGAILALSQIASKGTVQAEELRGQLGERIPGAFGIAARAMGVTEAQLNKLLETGSVTANDFLPKFARQLQVEFAGSAQSASKNVQSSLNNLGSAFQNLQENTGQLFTPAVAAGANVLTTAIGLLANNVDKLLLLATAVAFRFSGLGGIKLDGLGAQVKGLAQVNLFGAGGAFAKGGAGRAALGQAAGTIGQAALLAGVVESGRAIGEVFSLSEKGQQFKEFGDQGEANLKRIEDAAKRARGEIDNIPSKPEKSTSKGFDLSFGLLGLTGLDKAGLSFKTDDVIKGINAANAKVNPIFGLKKDFANLTTVEELQQQRDAEKFDRFRDFNRKLTGGANDEDANSLAGAKNLDNQIQALQNRKNLLSSAPNADSGQLKDIDAQIAAKQAERKTLIDPFLEKQSAVTAQINNVKQALNTDGLSPEQKKGLESDLRGLLDQQNAFDLLQRKIGITADKSRDLNNAFAEMNSKLEEVKRQSENAFNAGTAQDLTQQLANFGSNANASISAPVESARRELDRASAQFEGNRQVLSELADKLKDPEILDKLNSIRIGSTGKSVNLQSTIAELELAKGTASNDVKPILENLINYKKAQDQQTSLEKDGAQARIALKKAEEAAKLAEIQKATQQRESEIKRNSNTAQIGLLQRQTKGNEFESDIQVDSAKQQLKKGTAELDSTKQQLDEIESAYAAGTISAEEYEKQRREIGDRISDQEVQNAQNELALVKATEAAKLAEIDRAARKREAQIKQQESRATVGLVSDKTRKLVSDDEFSIAQARNSLTTDNAQQSNVQAQIDELDAAFARGIVKREEYEKRSQDLANSLADLNVKKAQDELAIREAIDKKILESRKRLITGTGLDQGLLGNQGQAALIGVDIGESQKRLSAQSAELGNLQQQLQASSAPVEGDIFAQIGAGDRVAQAKEIEERINRITASSVEERTKIRELELQRDLKLIAAQGEAEERALDRKKSALDAELKLSQAIADSRQSQLKIGIDRNGESVDAFKQLQGKNAGYQLSKVLKDQLTDAGFNTSNTQQGVIDALQNKQALEAEADREKVAALLQQQALERESVKLGLQKEQISARTALNEAKRVESLAKLNLAEAQGGLAKARRSGNVDEIQSAQEQVKFAQEGVGLASEGVGLATLNAQTIDDKVQKELAASDFRQAQQRSELDAQNQLGKRARDRELASTADDVKFTGQLNFSGFAASAALQAPQTTNLPSIVPTVTPNTNQVDRTVNTAASTTNNSDVVAKLEQLYTGIIELANKPRSLTFNTTDPVSDYATFMNNAAGQSLRSN